MNTNPARLRVEQLDRTLASFGQLKGKPTPRDGWLRAIREALGRLLRVQASRIAVTAPTLFKAESAEAESRITPGQLRKLA